MSAPIARACGRDPVVCGKPSRHVFRSVGRLHPEVTADRTIMIGDRYMRNLILHLACSKLLSRGCVTLSALARLASALLFLIIWSFRIESDVLLGKNCGLKTLLVGTGIDNLGWMRSDLQ